MHVLFVGSNPSTSAKTLDAFCLSTKSGQILMSWIAKACPNIERSSCNVSNDTTPGNRPLKVSEIKASLDRLQMEIADLNPDYVVTLGKAAGMALTLLRLPHYAMPHPSGLNRKLNDPVYVAEKIKGLRDHLKPFKSSN